MKFYPKLIKTRKGYIQFDFVRAETKSMDTKLHPTFNFQLHSIYIVPKDYIISSSLVVWEDAGSIIYDTEE